MTYDRTVRIPEELKEDVALLSDADSLKPGPWLTKQVVDAIKARSKEVDKLKSKMSPRFKKKKRS